MNACWRTDRFASYVLQMSTGPGLAKLGVGLTSSNFLSDLEKVNKDDFTTGHFYELSCHVQSSKIPWKSVEDSLARVYQQDWS